MLWLLIALIAAVHALPPSLTQHTFNQEIQQANISLIEFFSPYCAHCKAFEPTWEHMLEDFGKEAKQLGIAMHQVNCVENGDLCNKEKITAYPSLKLYSPNGFIKTYPSSASRKQESLIKFMKHNLVDLQLDQQNQIESKSKLLNTESIVKIFGEVQKQPWLISFLPDDIDDDFDMHKYNKIWSILSNQLNGFGIGHIKCHDNQQFCKEFKIADTPQIKVVLPNFEVSKTIDYNGIIDFKKIYNFAIRAQQVSKLEHINSINLLDESNIKTKLSKLDSFPENQENFENYFIYLYDESTISKEDFQILPYLFKNLIQSENTKFYLSNDSTNFLKIMEKQSENSIKLINSGRKDIQFSNNKDKYELNHISTLPTLINFQKNDLNSKIYQSFGPMDSRDEAKLNKFILENNTPIIQELFSLETIHNDDENVVILPVSKPQELNQYLVKIHEYNELKSNKSYNTLCESREAKKLKSEHYKSNHKKFIKTLRKEISQPIYPKTIFYYINMEKHPNLLDSLDPIIIKDNFKYSTPLDQLPTSLLSINKIIPGPKPRGRLIGSPYGDSLRLLDNLHQYGIKGYLLAVLLINGVFIMIRKNKHRYSGSVLPLFNESKKMSLE